MEIEKEKSVHYPKPKQKIPKESQKFIKIFVRKEVMDIETKTDQLRDSSKEEGKQQENKT